MLLQHLHVTAWWHVARWSVLRNTSPSVSYFLSKFSYFVFFLFPVWFSCCFLEAYPSSNLFKFRVPGKVWMYSFHWIWPCTIWSYGCQDIEFGREVTQCRKFYNTFLGKFISLNPWQILSSPFYEGRRDIITQYCSYRLLQFFLSWYSVLHENSPKTTLFDLKIMKHLNRVLVFYWSLIHFNFNFGLQTMVLKRKIWSTR